ASEIITVEMTPGESVVSGATARTDVAVYLDGGDATIDDVVRIDTTRAADTTAPTVAGCTAYETELQVVFSEDVNSTDATTRGNFTVESPRNSGKFVDLSGATFAYDAATFTTTISNITLVYQNTYRVKVTNVKDRANPANTIVDNSIGNICDGTVDENVPPTVSGCSAGTTSVTVTFSEKVNQTDAENRDNYQIESPKGSGSFASLASATLIYDSQTKTVEIDGISLKQGDTFEVTVSNVKDLAGNPISPPENLTDNVCSGTVADDVPPTVQSCTANNTKVTVTFSEAMRTAGVQDRSNYAIESPIGTPVSGGTLTYDVNAKTATITFDAVTFNTGDSYQVTVSNVEDVAGNVIAAPDNECSGTVADSTPPTVVSCFADSTVLEVTYSEDVLSGVGQASVTNESNYDVESPIGTPVDINVGGVNVTYISARKTAIFMGVALSPGNAFEVTVHRVQDKAGNAITEDGVDNVCSEFLAPVYQPDARIQKTAPSGGAITGNNIYNTDAAGQSVSQTITADQTAAYSATFENDGNVAQTFVVKATETSDSGWTVTYKSGATNITSQVLSASGFTTSSVAVGGTATITVEMSAGVTVIGNTSKGATLKVYLDSLDTTVRDAVKATTTLSRPDLTIKQLSEGDASYGTNNVYESTPSGNQIETQVVDNNVTAYYQVKVENDGNV
ncbi:MAG: Ig-like domain-containing protein, partial [Armatimonadetes bacterium]|nr:Ig-like domain-containing protein [Armatimonadota bacterium]